MHHLNGMEVLLKQKVGKSLTDTRKFGSIPLKLTLKPNTENTEQMNKCILGQIHYKNTYGFLTLFAPLGMCQIKAARKTPR